MKLQPENTHQGLVQSHSGDDVFVIDNGKSVTDQDGKAFEAGCKVTRNHDEAIMFAVSCPSEFKILDQDRKTVYATKALNLEKNGRVSRFFSGPKNMLVQFEDMSLHNLEGGSLKWSREEGLSQLT
jgi:ribosomal protein L27